MFVFIFLGGVDGLYYFYFHWFVDSGQYTKTISIPRKKNLGYWTFVLTKQDHYLHLYFL